MSYESSVQAGLQQAADDKKAQARFMRDRAAYEREHADLLDQHASNLFEEAANLERMIDGGPAKIVDEFNRSGLSREQAALPHNWDCATNPKP